MSDAVKGLRQKEKHCSTFYFQDHQVGHVGREPPVKPTVAKQFHISTWQMSLKEETERNCFIFNLSCSHPPSQHFKKKKKTGNSPTIKAQSSHWSRLLGAFMKAWELAWDTLPRIFQGGLGKNTAALSAIPSCLTTTDIRKWKSAHQLTGWPLFLCAVHQCDKHRRHARARWRMI